MFTIGNAFDLLFDTTEPAREGVIYEERLWFRRPRPHNQTATEFEKWRSPARRAEHILKGKVLTSLDRWAANLEARAGKSGGQFDDDHPNLRANFSGELSALRHLPPRMPYDVFAMAGYLIEQAGIYHHLQPAKLAFDNGRCRAPDEHGQESVRHLTITQDDRDLVRAVAKAWTEMPHELLVARDGRPEDLANFIVSDEAWPGLEPLFESWAVVFFAYEHASVFMRLSTLKGEAEPAPGWWWHVWRLFAIADEAAKETARAFSFKTLASVMAGDDSARPWFETEYFMEAAIQLLRDKQGAINDGAGASFDLATLSIARPDIVSVLPKVRTPSVGCTLRSLSHHLALTPARGVARGRWTPNFIRARVPGAAMPDGQMNILIIPFPFAIRADAFCGSLAEAPPLSPGASGRVAERSVPRFGYFDVHQHWMRPPAGWLPPDGWAPTPGWTPPDTWAKPRAWVAPETWSRPETWAVEDWQGFQLAWYEHFVSFVASVIASARRHSPVIHAVAFPELSLDHEAYVRVLAHLEANEPDIELLIAGVSGKQASWRARGRPPKKLATVTMKHGNFVAVASIDRTSSGEGTRETIREKHHRWKLDRAQLRGYGLLGVLSPELQWWENIPLQSRRVDFGVIRQRAVISALICEDLARVDPCQQLIRAVAPNLTVALLMDAPQKAARWPARYATVLAEDPGTAVLTITSRALMARQDKLGLHPGSATDRIVAMWRDDKSDSPVEMNCPYDAQAVVLSVVEESSEDISLDGRLDDSAMAFRYAGHVPVRLIGAKAKTDYAQILGELELVS